MFVPLGQFSICVCVCVCVSILAVCPLLSETRGDSGELRSTSMVTLGALTGGTRREFLPEHESDGVVEGGEKLLRGPAVSQCVCNLPWRTMCSTLSMTKCQCNKPPAQSAPLCRGTLAVRLAALRRNNAPLPPQQEIRRLLFSLYLLLWQYVIFSPPHTQPHTHTPPPPPWWTSVWCLQFAHKPTWTHASCCVTLPRPTAGAASSLNLQTTATRSSLFVCFCLVSMQSATLQSWHHSQASVSLPVIPFSRYLDAREDLPLIRVCFPLFHAGRSCLLV